MRLLLSTLFACACLGAPGPRGRCLRRRPLRDPGRRLARSRRRHARRAARPARAARRRRRPLQPALGQDRDGARRVRLGGQRRRAQGPARPRDPGRRRHRRHTGLGQRRQDAELRAERQGSRLLRPGGGDAVPLGDAMAALERAEPGALAAADLAGRVREPDPQPRLRGDPLRDPARPCRRRRHRPARLDRRRLAGAVDPRHAPRRRPPRRLCAPPVPVEPARDAVRGRLQLLRDDHDGDARAAARRGRHGVRTEADLADRVRLPDRAPSASPSSARRSCSASPACARTRRRASTC